MSGKGGKGLGKGGAARHREVLDKARVAYGVKDFEECYEITSALVRKSNGEQSEEISKLYFESLEACKKYNRDALQAMKKLGMEKNQLSPEVVESYKARYENQLDQYSEDSEEMMAIYFLPQCETSEELVNILRMRANSCRDEMNTSSEGCALGAEEEQIRARKELLKEIRDSKPWKLEGEDGEEEEKEEEEEDEYEDSKAERREGESEDRKRREREIKYIEAKERKQNSKKERQGRRKKKVEDREEKKGEIEDEDEECAHGVEEKLEKIRAKEELLEEIRDSKHEAVKQGKQRGKNTTKGMKYKDEECALRAKKEVFEQIKDLKGDCSPSASKRSMGGKKKKSRDLPMQSCASCGVAMDSPCE